MAHMGMGTGDYRKLEPLLRHSMCLPSDNLSTTARHAINRLCGMLLLVIARNCGPWRSVLIAKR
jgi:hypothetical protein